MMKSFLRDSADNQQNQLSSPVKRAVFVDTAGACLSFACAIHCLAMPLLVTILPLIGLGFVASEPAEWVVLFSAVGIAIGSVAWGIRHHRSWRAFLILMVALAFLFVAKTGLEGSFEVGFHVVGGILLASAHLLNRYLCRTCPHCEDESHRGTGGI